MKGLTDVLPHGNHHTMQGLVAFRLTLFLLSTSLVLLACHDDSTSSDDSNNNSGGGSHEFAIVSLETDSVYLGEHIGITIANVPSEQLHLQLGDAILTMDTVWKEDTLTYARFSIPEEVGSGLFAAFSGGVQAKGARTITLLNRTIASFASKLEWYAPRLMFTGDLMTLVGSDLPWRRKDFKATLNGVSLPILGWTDRYLYLRVTPEAQSGMVEVQLLDTIVYIGPFTKLEPGGKLLAEGTVKRIRVECNSLKGERRIESKIGGSDLLLTDLNQVLFDVPLSKSLAVTGSDSVIIEGEEVSATATKRIVLRLKPDSENRASGTVHLYHTIPAEGFERTLNMKIQNVRWVQWENKAYHLNAYSLDLPNHLNTLTDRRETPEEIETRTYMHTSPYAAITITLEP